jgi:hypothetical protein
VPILTYLGDWRFEEGLKSAISLSKWGVREVGSKFDLRPGLQVCIDKVIYEAVRGGRVVCK